MGSTNLALSTLLPRKEENLSGMCAQKPQRREGSLLCPHPAERWAGCARGCAPEGPPALIFPFYQGEYEKVTTQEALGSGAGCA